MQWNMFTKMVFLKTDLYIGTFEARIMEYREEMQDTPTIKQNVKEMGRRVKNFFQVSGKVFWVEVALSV